MQKDPPDASRYPCSYKHYPEETISGVLDEIVGPDDMDSENFPSEKSMGNIKVPGTLRNR